LFSLYQKLQENASSMVRSSVILNEMSAFKIVTNRHHHQKVLHLSFFCFALASLRAIAKILKNPVCFSSHFELAKA